MIYSILYVILTSSALLLVNHSFSLLPPLFTLLGATCITLIYFHLVNLAKIPTIYKKCWQHKSDWLLLSLTITFVWIGTFYGTMYIGIFGFLYIYFLTSGILGFVFKQITEKNFFSVKLISIIGLVALLLIFILLQENSSSTNHIYRIGVAYSLLAGLAGFSYSKSSYILFQKTHLTSSHILAIRFYGIVLFSLFFLPAHPLSYLTTQDLLLIVGISLFNFILPLYFGQLAILKMGPENATIIFATCPIAAYFIEGFILHHWLPYMLPISIACSFFLALPYLWQRTKS